MKHEIFVFDATAKRKWMKFKVLGLIHLTYNSIIFCYRSKKKNMMFWLNAVSPMIMEHIQVCINVCLPQSCGDYICFDAGFKRIKCDTTQHLQNKSIHLT